MLSRRLVAFNRTYVVLSNALEHANIARMEFFVIGSGPIAPVVHDSPEAITKTLKPISTE